MEIGTIVIYDKWLAEIIGYDNPSKIYIVESFSVPSITYQVDLDSSDYKIAEIGDKCLVDDNRLLYKIVDSSEDEITVQYGDQIRHIAKYSSKEAPEHDNKIRDVVKESNPKDAIGSNKISITKLSMPVMGEVALGMCEGGIKYGAHNYREIGVRASVYIDAAMFRHLGAWWEGEDIDQVSGISHISKAISSLMVLRDAQIRGKMYDDRPKGTVGWVEHLNQKYKELIDNYEGEPKQPYLANGRKPDIYQP